MTICVLITIILGGKGFLGNPRVYSPLLEDDGEHPGSCFNEWMMLRASCGLLFGISLNSVEPLFFTAATSPP